MVLAGFCHPLTSDLSPLTALSYAAYRSWDMILKNRSAIWVGRRWCRESSGALPILSRWTECGEKILRQTIKPVDQIRGLYFLLLDEQYGPPLWDNIKDGIG